MSRIDDDDIGYWNWVLILGMTWVMYENDVDEGNHKIDDAFADDADDIDMMLKLINLTMVRIIFNPKESSPTSSFSAVSKQKPMKSARLVFHSIPFFSTSPL